MPAQFVGLGNLTPAEALAGGTFASDSGVDQTGTMPDEGAVVLTASGTGTVAIPAGYHDGSGYVAEVTVPAADVLTGTTIAGVAGTMPNQGDPTFTPTAETQTGPAGYYTGLTVGASTYQAGSGPISTITLTLTFTNPVRYVAAFWKGNNNGPFGSTMAAWIDTRVADTVFYGSETGGVPVTVSGIGTTSVTLTTGGPYWQTPPDVVLGM